MASTFFGHPRGLATLFFTEMWERFGFYGMRALLILFMVDPTSKGGLGMSTAEAGMIYGIFTAMVYLISLPGGWLADSILGQRKAVLYGGILIAAGYYAMVLHGLTSFYIALALVAVGTGLLKPNVSTIVGGLYEENDRRRDAGFSIFYMGINVGALISPLACGTVAKLTNWHYGFGLSGVGMTIGLIQFVLGQKHLQDAGLRPPPDPVAKRQAWLGAAVLAGIFAVVTGLSAASLIHVSPAGVSNALGLFLTLVVVGVFSWLLLDKRWTPVERKRLGAILVLFVASALFWSAFEQAGSTLSLFADRNTRLSVFGWAFPASYLQSENSVFLVLLAPVFAALWLKLGRREPSTTIKFSFGLLFVGLGFAVLIPVANGQAVSPFWLTLTYLLHTIGELSLSPVGLSAMTKLAPQRIVAMIMGVWFLSISVGEWIGGRVAAVYDQFPLPTLFGVVAGFCIVCAALLTLFNKPMKRLSGGVN
jgi:proton-dependent oligopeptide transporter, POT family